MVYGRLGDGKVVSLFPGRGRMNYPAIAQVDAYWEALRDGRLMPERSEVDPRGLSSALEFAFILEHIAPGVGRIRVAGMHLNDLLGMAVCGMPMTAFFEPAARDGLSRALDAVVTQPRVADLSLSAAAGIGRPALKARLYLAPLGNGGGAVPRVLGCLQAIGGIGRAPRRFGIDQVHLRRIVATAPPAARNAAPAQRPVMPGFAEDGAIYAPQAPRGGKPKLRLVKSGD